jgi:predicted thioesterase
MHPWPKSVARSVRRRFPASAEEQVQREEEMKGSPKVGTTGEQRFVVEPSHAIDFADSTMPAVLSTPWLIWFLEHAARQAVLPFLASGESTVGTYVEVHHSAPTPVGQTVTCLARVVRAEGTTITFQLEARDGHERIARGYHRLQVIRVERFAQRVHQKSGPS